MDAEGAVARLVDLGGPCKLRASLDRLVLLTQSPSDDSSAAIRVVDLAGGGTITTSHPRPADRFTKWFGFGRAARSGVLKLVCISVVTPCSHVTYEVLTLGDGGSGWSRPRLGPKMVRYTCDCNEGVAVNGVVHFLSVCQDDILCFDLESDEWRTIRGPL
jgi:hypothetical protein